MTTWTTRSAQNRPSRLLYVSGTPLIPSKLGPARRNYHILEQLARFYDVSALTIGAQPDAEYLQRHFRGTLREVTVVPSKLGRRLKFFRKVWRTATGKCDFLPAVEPELQRSCREVAGGERFDAIFLSSVLLGSLPLPDSTPVIADTHNAEFDVHRQTATVASSRCRRWYARRQARSTRGEERRCATRAAVVLATSERDKQLFQCELGISQAQIIPNGIDLGEFPPTVPSTQPVIVFSGLQSYYPNQQGIRWFLDEVFPVVLRTVPRACVVIAGAAPPRWLIARRSAQVQVTGPVADIRPYIRSAGVVIAPLKIGGGTRVKILEAQVMARPVVSTSVGAEGLGQRGDDTLLIADDAASFARHVVHLLMRREDAYGLAVRGRLHAARNYGWYAIGETLRQLLDAQLRLRSRGGDA